MTPDAAATPQLAESIRVETAYELANAADMVRHCLAQLDEAQIWWRPDESMNSIGNLVLHLCGNVRQWIVAGLGGAPDERQRQAEFDQRQPIPTEQLAAQLTTTLEAARATIANITAADLLSPLRVQGFEVNGLRALLHSVSHFRGHTQEIVHLTRQQLGDAYRFDFVPRSAAEGTSEP